MVLVIMAAGMGSRYGGLKQLDPIGPCGEFILDYSIYDAKRAGFTKVVFVIKEENLELFRETVGRRIERVMEVGYVFQKLDTVPELISEEMRKGSITVPEERKKPWGTAHAVYCCKDEVTEDFAVINADDFYGKEAFELLYKQMKSARAMNEAGKKQQYCMVGYRLSNTLTENGHVSRGVCLTDNEAQLQSIAEHTKIQRDADGILRNHDGINDCELAPETIVSMNCWGFTREMFSAMEKGMVTFFHENKDNLAKAEYYLLTVVQDEINNRNCDVKVLDTAETWFGVTYKEDRQAVVESVRTLITKGVYPVKLWS